MAIIVWHYNVSDCFSFAAVRVCVLMLFSSARLHKEACTCWVSILPSRGPKPALTSGLAVTRPEVCTWVLPHIWLKCVTLPGLYEDHRALFHSSGGRSRGHPLSIPVPLTPPTCFSGAPSFPPFPTLFRSKKFLRKWRCSSEKTIPY